MKHLIFTVVFFVSGCGYHKDSLLIQNKTNEQIYCEILIKKKYSSQYIEVAANLKIDAASQEHPIVRSPISIELKKNSLDSILYIVFHNYSDREYIFKNIDSIVFDRRFKTSKYSMSKLDSLNWTVKYNLK